MNIQLASQVAPSTWGYLGNTMESAGKLAKALVATGLAPQGMTSGQAFYILLAGAELGLNGPVEALRHVVVIKGKPSISAELMRALLLKQGCKIEWKRTDATGATIKITRPEGTVGEFTFDENDAKRAGLLNNNTWKSYPNAMYQARVTSLAARAFCPDMLRGASYTPDEIGARPIVTPEGEVGYETPREVVNDSNDDDPEPNGNGAHTAPPERKPLEADMSVVNSGELNPVSTGQVQALAILARQKMGAWDDEERIVTYSEWIGRGIGSSKDLTVSEWRVCVDELNKLPDAPKNAPKQTTATAVEDDPHELWSVEETDAQRIARFAKEKKMLDSEGFLVINPRAAAKWSLPQGTWSITHLVDQGHAERLLAMLEA